MSTTQGRLLWQALREVASESSSRRDWRERLGGEWAAASRYLKPTGEHALQIACPSPGGDGCPRRVIKLAEGKVRAACGLRPAECETLELSLDDVALLRLDRHVLAERLCSILKADVDLEDAGSAFRIGWYGIVAGARASIIVAFPGRIDSDLRTISRTIKDQSYGLIIVPTAAAISTFDVASLGTGWNVVTFSDVAELGKDGLHGANPADVVFAPIRQRAISDFGLHQAERAWLLPADATWEKLVFEFTAADSLNVRFGHETRTFDSASLGMRRKNTLKPTSQWSLLQAFAEANGRIDWSNPKAEYKVKKQKQLLSKKLIDAFGIEADPVVHKDGAYRTRFTIRGSPLGMGNAADGIDR